MYNIQVFPIKMITNILQLISKALKFFRSNKMNKFKYKKPKIINYKKKRKILKKIALKQKYNNYNNKTQIQLADSTNIK